MRRRPPGPRTKRPLRLNSNRPACISRRAPNSTQGEYNKAIVEFLKAYNAVPNALFLYNISLSYGKLGNVDDALAAALKARDGEGLDAETQNRNSARILAFRRAQSATDVASEMAALAEQAPPPPPPKENRFGALGWTGVGLTVVGAGLTVGSFVIANSLSDRIDEYETAAANGDRTRYETLRSEIRNGQTVGQVLLFAGTGAAALGLVFVLTDLVNDGGERDVSAAVGPVPGGGFAGHLRLSY